MRSNPQAADSREAVRIIKIKNEYDKNISQARARRAAGVFSDNERVARGLDRARVQHGARVRRYHDAACVKNGGRVLRGRFLD